MSLRFAILTALSEKSSTGIELARRFDRSIGYFWPAAHQQIYRELDKLLTDGLIAQRESDQAPSRGNPRHFTVTEAGTQSLVDWVNEEEGARAGRDPLMVRIRASAIVPQADPRPALQRRIADHQRNLVEYDDIKQRHFSGELDRTARRQLLILEAGINSERTMLEWCERVLAELDREP